jgi:hypothetical protein
MSSRLPSTKSLSCPNAVIALNALFNLLSEVGSNVVRAVLNILCFLMLLLLYSVLSGEKDPLYAVNVNHTHTI